jgi:hypothetical protein
MKKLARAGSQLERAIAIYHKNLGNDNHRQLCLTEFQSTLGQKTTTAATYYYLAERKINAHQSIQTQSVIESNRKSKFSAVKFTRGSERANRVHCFFSKRDAQCYNIEHNYNAVVKGIQELGKEVGIVAVA